MDAVHAWGSETSFEVFVYWMWEGHVGFALSHCAKPSRNGILDGVDRSEGSKLGVEES